jgi:hypothetical protein
MIIKSHWALGAAVSLDIDVCRQEIRLVGESHNGPLPVPEMPVPDLVCQMLPCSELVLPPN